MDKIRKISPCSLGTCTCAHHGFSSIANVQSSTFIKIRVNGETLTIKEFQDKLRGWSF